jgi:hypothetical protein
LISMRRRRAPQNFDSKWKWWSSWYAAWKCHCNLTHSPCALFTQNIISIAPSLPYVPVCIHLYYNAFSILLLFVLHCINRIISYRLSAGNAFSIILFGNSCIVHY